MRKQNTIQGDHNLTELNGSLEPKYQKIPSNWIVENLISRCYDVTLMQYLLRNDKMTIFQARTFGGET